MRDANIIYGQVVTYKKRKYTIGDIYFIHNNLDLYVQLISDGTNLNVKLNDIIPLIVRR